ncbi:MAG: class I SAM-dependent methyltransferase [Actinomycetota bacterium]
MAERGENPHGEADFVERLSPTGSVLDAGCGTGRLAIELARRGREVVGVDLDESMLSSARSNGPDLTWVRADLATLDLGRTFNAVVMAGNVMIFLEPGTEGDVMARLAAHLVPDGVLVAGFQLGPDRLSLAEYDRLAAAAGLAFVNRFATWDADRWIDGGDYAVSVHRRSD